MDKHEIYIYIYIVVKTFKRKGIEKMIWLGFLSILCDGS
jgi:hypothetical protein